MTEIVEHMCDKKTHFTLFMIWIRINLYIVEVGKYIKAGNAIMGRLLSLFMGGDFYIAISVGTLACYLFLLSCFVSISREERVVHYLRIILVALSCWTGGSVLMRLQISPGMQFWFHFSILGLLIIPVGMYGFLFCVLEIQGKQKLLNICMLASIVTLLLNAYTECLLPVPEIQQLPGGNISYIYHARPGIWLWIVAEWILLIYVTVLAHRKIGTQYEYRRKLGPLLLGMLLVFAGNIACITPLGKNLPLDALGGAGMAICILHVIFTQYFFSISSRFITGAAYFGATVVAFIPVVWFGCIADGLFDKGSPDEQIVIIFIVAEGIWCILISALARSWAEHILIRKRKYIVDSLLEFQDSVTSIMNKDKLYQMIRETVNAAVKDCCVHILEERDGVFAEYTENGMMPLAKEVEAQLEQFLDSGRVYKDPAFAVFKYDAKIYGFLYVELCRKNRLIYDEIDCIRQIGNSVSSVLKSINAYERLYQVSIHDGLTGLYNRNFCRENLGKLDITARPVGMIYMDMDNFKLYNELYGESIGDQVLCWCAKQLQEAADDSMKVFRMGANEFLIITAEDNKDKLISFAKQIQKIMLETTEDKPKVIQLITFSIGIAWDKSMAEDADELAQQAKRASFYAKGNGKNCIEVYEKDLKEKDQESESSEKGYSQVSPTIFALMAAIDAKDSFTFEHSENVSGYAEKLAAKLGLPKEDIQTVKVAGLLHDIGKIGIQDSILKKQGKLTDEEYSIIKTHVEKSVEMIRVLPHMDYVIPAVLSHHERYDGKGYPNGIRGNEIPILGRILTVCDSFDAMVSRRAYKEAMSIEYATGELERGKGTQFDPDVAQAFIELIRENPSFIAQ